MELSPTGPHTALDVQALYKEHGRFIGRLIRRLTGDGAHVDDLLQETFVAAFRHRERFEGRSSVETWLYAIAANLCRNHYRNTSRWTLFAERLGREDEAVTPGPGEQIERREAANRVHRALAKLPWKQREVVVLYELEGREGTEIAEITNVPIGTVWTRLHDGRKRLEKLLTRDTRRGGES
jgi:RNA polymerase sigma-70 factor, ECF subfamily